KLADEAPIYQREAREPDYLKAVRSFTLADISDTNDVPGALRALLAWPTIASKNWVYRQYDQTVRDGTVVSPGSDAAVIRIKEDSLPPVGTKQPSTGECESTEHGTRITEKLIALTVDGNATYVYLNPFEGSKIA